LANISGIKIIFSVHPRTKKNIKKFDLLDKLYESKSFLMIDPVGYLDMLVLINNAHFILTDSGGLHETGQHLEGDVQSWYQRNLKNGTSASTWPGTNKRPIIASVC
ncbi:MAG: UDP-N-acetylglucosamine 2-epimerase, partial [Bacteroidales bacterium]